MGSTKTFAEEEPDDVLQKLQEVRADLRARDSVLARTKQRGRRLLASAQALAARVREAARERLASWSATIRDVLERAKPRRETRPGDAVPQH